MEAVNLNERRLRSNPDTFRRLKAAAMLKLFRQANGHGPKNMDQFMVWRSSNNIDAADPFDVLTETEVAELAKAQ